MNKAVNKTPEAILARLKETYQKVSRIHTNIVLEPIAEYRSATGEASVLERLVFAQDTLYRLIKDVETYERLGGDKPLADKPTLLADVLPEFGRQEPSPLATPADDMGVDLAEPHVS